MKNAKMWTSALTFVVCPLIGVLSIKLIPNPFVAVLVAGALGGLVGFTIGHIAWRLGVR